MKHLFFLLTLLFNTAIFSQIGMGQWRMHIPSTDAINIAEGKNSIHVLFNNALLSYDLKSGELTRRDKINYLTEISLSTIGYHQGSSQLFIGYENGNIDVLKNERIINLPYILNANLTGDKKIYSVRSHNDFAYLCTGFGIIVIDTDNLEVLDTYYPTSGNKAIKDINFLNDSIYALTADEIYVGALNNDFLADPSQWVLDPRVNDYSAFGEYQQIVSFENEQIVFFEHNNYEEDSVLFINTGNSLVNNREVGGICTSNGRLMVCAEGGVLVYDQSFNEELNIYQYHNQVFPSARDAIYKDGNFYIADNRSGFIKAKDAFNSSSLGFDGPYNKLASSLDWGDGRLLVGGGQLSGGINPSFSRNGAYTFKDESWENFNANTDPYMNTNNVWDVLSVAVDPNDAKRFALGTYSYVPLLISENGVSITDTFTPNNSILESTSLLNGWSYISDMAYDNDGTLWILNSLSSKPLKAYTKDGQWFEFDFPNTVTNEYTRDLVIDYNGVKWFGVRGAGVVAFDEGDDLLDTSDDRFKVLGTSENDGNLPSGEVFSITADFDNEIWVGTPVGLRVLYNSSQVFDADPGEYNFQNILKQFEEFTEEVLKNVSISKIEVDGANRKWIATESSGLFLFSENGIDLIRSFTVDNSPLISNSILDISIDHRTGELYIATDNGLVSYRSDATYGDLDYENVVVFPNPVRPEYSGPISMQGIAYNSEVRITDVAGNLVFSTVSNGGTVTWNGKTLSGERASTGVYLIWTSPAGAKGRQVGKVVFIN